MTSNTCLREFSRYTILSVLGTLGVSCYILADTFFISLGLGADGLTALNLAIPVYNFIHGVGLLIGMGGATRFSILQSQGRKEESHQICTNALYLAGFFSVFFFLPGFFLSGPLAALLGADAHVWQMTDTYLRWLLLFSPAFLFNDVFLCFARNDGSPQLSMAAMVTGSFANILLDYVFIFPLDMGIFGAILATGLSPVISMAMMAPHWLKRDRQFHLARIGVVPFLLRQITALGSPSLIAQISSGVVMIAFNTIILTLEGNTGVAAYGVVANLSLVVTAIYTGLAQGAQPLVSRFYGAGERKSARTALRYAMITMAVLSFGGYFLTVFFASPIAAAFNREGHVLLQQIAEEGLRLYFTSNLAVGFNTILAVYFASVEQAVPAQLLSLLRGFILILPSAFLLARLRGMTGVWLAYPVAESVTALLGLALLAHFERKAGA